jgi:hypothetical protein
VWGVWLEDRFCFGTDPNSIKGRNLRRSPSMVVHLESGDETVILEGSVRLMEDPALIKRFADAYDAKYKVRPAGGYCLDATKAFAWRESDFPKTATRWIFRQVLSGRE